MSIISKYKLTNCSMKLIEYLFYYRGMTALQLTQMYYELEKPLSTQKSNIHNYLAKLKKQKIVASKKIDDPLHPGSIYYLTKMGFEVVKVMLNIDVGAKENGFILLNERSGIPTQSDLPFELYQPPKQQINHHLLLIDLFIQLRIHFSEEEAVDHRLSIYCSTEYTLDSKDYKISPDAEILLPNKESFWIEADRSTENHSQLLAKFENYKNYLIYLKKHDLPIPFKGILFLTDEKQQRYGLKRRWTNILSAFLKEMYPFNQDVRLILTPINNLEKTIHFEMSQIALNQIAKHQVYEKLHQKGYEKVIPFSNTVNKTLSYAIAISEKSYDVFFLNVSNAFDSSMYTNFHRFIQKLDSIRLRNEVKGFQQQGVGQIIFHPDKEPFIIPTLQATTSSDKTLVEGLEMLNRNLEFEQIELTDD